RSLTANGRECCSNRESYSLLTVLPDCPHIDHGDFQRDRECDDEGARMTAAIVLTIVVAGMLGVMRARPSGLSRTKDVAALPIGEYATATSRTRRRAELAWQRARKAHPSGQDGGYTA